MSIFGRLSAFQKVLLAVASVFIVSVAGVGLYYFFPRPTVDNQGYMPDQPIPFSHKKHAGELKIDCRYCHTGAYKTRHAGIPSMNICMNCHRVVKTDSPHIQNLTQHFNEGKPIEWIRVHEEPDFVFFNHRPHVAAGVACQTCHGPVQEMEKIYQAEPLTMGWCKDCHDGRTTPPAVLKKIHKGLENPRGKAVAPTNCSTCHY